MAAIVISMYGLETMSSTTVTSTSAAARGALSSRLVVNWLLTAPLIGVLPPARLTPSTSIGGDPLSRTARARTPSGPRAESRSPIGRSCIRALPVISVSPSARLAMVMSARSPVPAFPM